MPDLKADFALWVWMETTLGDCPASEMEQLREEIHEVWHDEEQRTYWTKRITEEANRARELRELAKGITRRIKDEIEAEKRD